MIRTPAEYHRPATPAAVAELLGEHGSAAAVIGGGTWLLPQLNRGERAESHLIDLRGLDLEPIVATAERFELAATATYEDVLADQKLCAALPALARMAAGVTGGRQLRNQATLVGSACHQTPSSEAPAMFLALDAEFRIVGNDGERWVAAADFFLGAFRTALAADEFVAAAQFPATAHEAGYLKVKIAAGGWPVATAVATRRGPSEAPSLVLGAVQQCPLRIDLSAAMADATRVRNDAVAAVVAEQVTDPWDDLQADAEYRRRIAGPVARRAIEQMEGEGR
jgi:carbon-monoxide dehydrogenase medium subunit